MSKFNKFKTKFSEVYLTFSYIILLISGIIIFTWLVAPYKDYLLIANLVIFSTTFISFCSMKIYSIIRNKSYSSKKKPTYSKENKDFANAVIDLIGIIFPQKDVDEWSGDLLESHDRCRSKGHSRWYCRIWLLKEVAYLAWPRCRPAIKKLLPWAVGGAGLWAFVRTINPFGSRRDD